MFVLIMLVFASLLCHLDLYCPKEMMFMPANLPKPTAKVVSKPALKTTVSDKQPKLLDRVRTTIRLRNYSIRTEEAYVAWIERFIRYHKLRHPQEMGAPEIEAFLAHLAVEGNVAASTQNQALCALLFLYKQVLYKE